MSMHLRPCFALVLLLAAAPTLSVSAQTPAPPTPARAAPVISPEVKADRSVTFRLKAPNAKQVSVRGQWTKESLPLTRGDDGVWTGAAPAVTFRPP